MGPPECYHPAMAAFDLPSPTHREAAQSASALVEARGLTKDYARDGGATRVVDDVSFTILAGETLGLVCLLYTSRCV